MHRGARSWCRRAYFRLNSDVTINSRIRFEGTVVDAVEPPAGADAQL